VAEGEVGVGQGEQGHARIVRRTADQRRQRPAGAAFTIRR
jgi:hypothetical protein